VPCRRSTRCELGGGGGCQGIDPGGQVDVTHFRRSRPFRRIGASGLLTTWVGIRSGLALEALEHVSCFAQAG
jgi:hypothetical protein